MPASMPGTLPPLMQIAFNKMRQSILTNPTTSEYLTGWQENPRLASLFPSLGYTAASIVISNGEPPEGFSSIAKLEKYFSEEREMAYRKMFVQDRDNPQLDDPYLLLEKVWEDGETVDHVKRPLTKREDSMFMLFKESIASGPERVMVSSLAEFQRNWESLTQGLFKHVEFENVFIAGGAVVAALQPGKKAGGENYFNSDIDVFIYGLELNRAKQRCVEIYEAIKKVTTGTVDFSAEDEAGEAGEDDHDAEDGEYKDGDVLCVRNLRSLILVGQYPRRHIQIVFRLYKSPAEVLMGFDIDSCCFGYDGKTVYALPRGMRAMTRRYNLVDMTRRSASYEYRLFKYAKRGFAIAVPYVHPDKIKQRHEMTFGEGLAKLLSLEAHELLTGYYRRKFDKKEAKKDQGEIIQADREAERRCFSSETKGDMSHYQSVKIPYGEKWPLARVINFIENFVQQASMCFNYGPLEESETKIEMKNIKEAFPQERGEYDDETPEELQDVLRKPMVCTVNNVKTNLDQYIPQYFPDRIQVLSFEECWMTTNPGEQLLTGSFEPVLTTWDQWFKDAYSEREVMQVRDDDDDDDGENDGDGDDEDQDSDDDGDVDGGKGDEEEEEEEKPQAVRKKRRMR
ncbi:Protein mono-ADP-ribosyltransferase parp4 [Phlyctochytrium planicorne]|nr:Protein mono-ADP-ribosyltransferase parp4 [Phlyctochytrium planicorne]